MTEKEALPKIFHRKSAGECLGKFPAILQRTTFTGATL